MSDIAVVVPTRDRPGPLSRCLTALGAQVTSGTVEVIVVDDASVDASAVAKAVAHLPGTCRLTGTGAGPAAARNLGAREASAPLVAFVDDDCAPDPGWIQSLLVRFAAGACVVAGPTVNGRPGDRFAAASQTVTNHLVETGLDNGTVTFAPTSNLAVVRDVHEDIRFDEEFPLAAGEDRDYCDRLAGAGHEIVYEPAALVIHFQDLGARGFWRQQRRYGHGAVHWRERGSRPERPAATKEQHERGVQGTCAHSPYPLRSLQRGRQPTGFYTGLVRAGASQGPAVGALVVAAQFATALGMAQARHALSARRRSQ